MDQPYRDTRKFRQVGRKKRKSPRSYISNSDDVHEDSIHLAGSSTSATIPPETVCDVNISETN